MMCIITRGVTMRDRSKSAYFHPHDESVSYGKYDIFYDEGNLAHKIEYYYCF